MSRRELSQSGVSSRLRALLDGAWIRNAAFERALAEAAQSRNEPPTATIFLQGLDREMLEGLAAGKTENAIAGSISASTGTVKRIITRLEARLDAKNRPSLVSKAWERGLLTTTPEE